MKRLAMDELIEWKNSKYRKPLILKGARQVGKTWLLKEFARTQYVNIAYFNFDENPEYKSFFETTKDVERILQNLMMASNQSIDQKKPENTLIVFDEIQECPNALGTLKYFHENTPHYHVACAGSLLGLALNKPASFPVGKVDFMEINPMSFSEFLLANGDENLVKYLSSISEIEAIPEAFFRPLNEKQKMYFVTGGMPEAVKTWTQERDSSLVERVLSNILNAYQLDFANHLEPKEFPKISMVWQSIPSQLARENKKFIYRVVKEGARAREYEDAIQWLEDANLISRVFRGTAPRLPLAAYDDLSAFKIYMADVGLLRRLSLLAPSAFAEGDRLFFEFNGALTENYILQSLNNVFEAKPRYWTSKDSRYEIDFLLQIENEIFPIEVKAGTNVASASLRKFKELYSDEIKLRLRYSLNNLKLDGDVLNIPLFLVDQTEEIVKLALNKI